MKQIRIHGRGGQGVVTAAELIAIAGFKSGLEAQAFPAFGVERTGAPIESFARLSREKIILREQISEPDVIIVQDPTLLNEAAITRGAGKNTIIIINTAKNKEMNPPPPAIASEALRAGSPFYTKGGVKFPAKNIFLVDATKIALEKMGKNLVNTTILGAFAKATNLVSLEALKEAIKEKFKEKGQETINKNISAIEEAYRVT